MVSSPDTSLSVFIARVGSIILSRAVIGDWGGFFLNLSENESNESIKRQLSGHYKVFDQRIKSNVFF